MPGGEGPQGLKPALILTAYAALKGPLFHGSARACGSFQLLIFRNLGSRALPVRADHNVFWDGACAVVSGSELLRSPSSGDESLSQYLKERRWKF
jgi:hypothetical protein